MKFIKTTKGKYINIDHVQSIFKNSTCYTAVMNDADGTFHAIELSDEQLNSLLMFKMAGITLCLYSEVFGEDL